MEYRYLGGSGLKVSEISLGAMTFNGGRKSDVGNVSQTEATEMTYVAIDLGINLIDTADVYSNGLSEEMVGTALGHRRKEVLIATKVRFPMNPKPNQSGLSRYHIIEGCEKSLKRLGTDYIDLYQIHGYDPNTPLEESLRALDDLVRSGKVRYIGCSNLAAWQTMKALAISQQMNLEKFISTQLYYSIGARDIEHELIPLCEDQKVGILCWSPLSGGFFTGKYRKSGEEGKGRRVNKNAASMKYWSLDEERGFRILDVLENISLKKGKNIASIALAWVLHKPMVSSLIIGATNLQQLKENAQASGIKLDAEDLEMLEKVSAPDIPYPQKHQIITDSR
ncbi:MAG: aldo/keto reductase [Bacteroidales bacterium]|nr:aldo/keto reductase [Bacteroidales bacterium]